MTKIIVLFQKQAENFTPNLNNNYVCISITDPEGGYVNLNQNHFLQTLRLQFHDIEKNMMESLGNYYFGMSEHDCFKVRNFLGNWWNKIDYIVIHCHAGISRSSGLPAAIEEFYNNDGQKYFRSLKYVPNQRCYRLLLEELNK